MSDIKSILNKRILVQTTYQPSPHLETELEIMEQLLDQGNIIYWIICEGDFKICFENPNHNRSECQKCNLRVLHGFKELKKSNINHKNLHILKYGQFLDLTKFENGFDANFSYSDINSLKEFKYKTYDSGLATVSSLVSYTRNHEPDLIKNQDFINRGLVTGAYLYDTFQLIFDNISPEFVLLFNGRFIENRPLLRVCQERKIDFATHERGGKINSFLFRINSIPHSLTTISAEIESLWKQSNYDRIEIAERFYKNRIKRVEDAWYSFTKEQQEGRLPESFKDNKTKKVITIFNSSLDEYEGLEGFGPYFYKNDNIGIEAICESLKNSENFKLYLRVHPNLKGLDNSQNKFILNLGLKYKNIEIISAQDSVDTYALINQSEIIIVFGSTVGIEAAYAAKKVVLLGKSAYQDLKCFLIPKNHSDLIDILTNPDYIFPEINHEDTLKYGYWNEKFGLKYHKYYPIKLDSGTYNGKKIELTWWQKKKIHYQSKFERKRKKYLSFLFKN